MYDTASDPAVPEVGDVVRHRGRCRTVTGWFRSAAQGGATEGVPRPLLFATRASATHLRVCDAESGVTVVRLADVEPTGDRALFAPNTIRAAHRMAAFLDGQPTDYCDPEFDCVEE